jgi:hypothetical protein
MKKWNWQWLALLGLAGIIFSGVEFLMTDLSPLLHLSDEGAIEVYHEPLYLDHFLVKKIEERRLKFSDCGLETGSTGLTG